MGMRRGHAYEVALETKRDFLKWTPFAVVVVVDVMVGDDEFLIDVVEVEGEGRRFQVNAYLKATSETAAAAPSRPPKGGR